jgi:ubiquinone/menaquinone biosynthesis C-methylase UbiE
MKSNYEWKQWGKADPLFAVSTWKGKEKGGAVPWTDEEFYELGRSDWEDFFAQWKTYGCDPGHCLEVGCGAGRLTKHLAGAFQTVTATDISEDQIAYARSRVDRENITYRLTDGVHFAAEGPQATAVFSTHVFQHFDTLADAERVLQEIFRALAPGGTVMIHLPVYALPPTLVTSLFRRMLAVANQVGTLRANVNRRRGKLIMRGLTYERAWLAECFAAIGFQRVEFRTFQVASNGDWHDFVLAEAPGQPGI